LGIESLFDSVTISSLAHAAKPAPKIFEVALEKHALDPEEAVHIGDSLRDDVEGAQKAGLTGILLDRIGAVQGASVPVIRTLDELFHLVARSQ
jgi:putative hydrolase of the HAD superfamily